MHGLLGTDGSKNGYKFKAQQTISDVIKDLKETGFVAESQFLQKFFEYAAEHIIPRDWKGFLFQQIMAMKVGSFASSFIDSRGCQGKRWSFGHIETLKVTDTDTPVMTLADTKLDQTSYLEYLSGRCFDFYIIWDRIVPFMERDFLGATSWQDHNLTNFEKQHGFTSNQGKRFYELE